MWLGQNPRSTKPSIFYAFPYVELYPDLADQCAGSVLNLTDLKLVQQPPNRVSLYGVGQRGEHILHA